MWDWNEWYPNAIPCDPDAGGRTTNQCSDGVTLAANYDANGELASFRYDNVDEFDGDKNGAMFIHDDLMLYMYGLKSADEIDHPWHCIGAGESWEGAPGNRNAIHAPTNTTFTISDVISAFGDRDPP